MDHQKYRKSLDVLEIEEVNGKIPTKKEVTVIYKKLAKIYHTDKSPDQEDSGPPPTPRDRLC